MNLLPTLNRVIEVSSGKEITSVTGNLDNTILKVVRTGSPSTRRRMCKRWTRRYLSDSIVGYMPSVYLAVLVKPLW